MSTVLENFKTITEENKEWLVVPPATTKAYEGVLSGNVDDDVLSKKLKIIEKAAVDINKYWPRHSTNPDPAVENLLSQIADKSTNKLIMVLSKACKEAVEVKKRPRPDPEVINDVNKKRTVVDTIKKQLGQLLEITNLIKERQEGQCEIIRYIKGDQCILCDKQFLTEAQAHLYAQSAYPNQKYEIKFIYK